MDDPLRLDVRESPGDRHWALQGEGSNLLSESGEGEDGTGGRGIVGTGGRGMFGTGGGDDGVAGSGG